MLLNYIFLKINKFKSSSKFTIIHVTSYPALHMHRIALLCFGSNFMGGEKESFVKTKLNLPQI